MNADERLAAAVLHFVRAEPDAYSEGIYETDATSWAAPEVERHLRQCPDLVVSDVNGFDTSCPEGTCEFVKLEATLTCPHGYSGEYEYYTPGWLEDVFAAMDRAGANAEAAPRPTA